MKKCTNPETNGKIALEITFNIAQRKGVQLSPEQCQHLVECERCNQMLPLWFKKGMLHVEQPERSRSLTLLKPETPEYLKRAPNLGSHSLSHTRATARRGLW